MVKHRRRSKISAFRSSIAIVLVRCPDDISDIGIERPSRVVHIGMIGMIVIVLARRPIRALGNAICYFQQHICVTRERGAPANQIAPT